VLAVLVLLVLLVFACGSLVRANIIQCCSGLQIDIIARVKQHNGSNVKVGKSCGILGCTSCKCSVAWTPGISVADVTWYRQ
jgi:hypothetical protein